MSLPPQNVRVQPTNPYRNVAAELLVAIRDEKSQAFLVKRLGLKSNLISKWELAQSTPSWNEFERLCHYCHANPGATLRRIIGPYKDLPDLIKKLIGHRTVRAAATDLGVSRAKLGRWMTGDVSPSLAEVLWLLDLRGSLNHFVSSLAEKKEITTVMDGVKLDRAARDLFHQFPETPMVLCFFCLSEYASMPANNDRIISNRLGMSLKRYRDVVTRLEDIGMLARVHDKYILTDISINTVATNEKEFRQDRAIKAFWARHCADLMEHDDYVRRRSSTAYRVFAASTATAEKIKAEVSRFHDTIYRILEDETVHGEGERLQILSLQLCDLLPP